MSQNSPPRSSAPTQGGFDPGVIERLRQDSLQDKAAGPGRAIPDVPLAQHVNHTPFWSQYYQSVDCEGEVFHTVVTRVGYDMRTVRRGPVGGPLGYASEAPALAMGDEFAQPAHPHHSELLWESDFCPFKPKCDVLVVNAATRPDLSEWQRHVSIHLDPALRPRARRWTCALALDWTDEAGQSQHWHKHLNITGPRHIKLWGGVSEPEQVSEVLLGWAQAFGGPGDERNPLGVGHAQRTGDKAPQQEVGGQPFRGGLLQLNYPPAGLGPIGKAWRPRRSLAGTYDNTWLKTQWPLPPKDFDYGFWNCAPTDQQLAYPPPGARISLLNLWPPMLPGQRLPAGNPDTETWRGTLPEHQLFVLWRLHSGPMLIKNAWLDTLIVNLAAQRIDAVYRSVMSARAGVRVAETRLERDPPAAQARLNALERQLRRIRPERGVYGR